MAEFDLEAYKQRRAAPEGAQGEFDLERYKRLRHQQSAPPTTPVDRGFFGNIATSLSEAGAAANEHVIGPALDTFVGDPLGGVANTLLDVFGVSEDTVPRFQEGSITEAFQTPIPEDGPFFGGEVLAGEPVPGFETSRRTGEFAAEGALGLTGIGAIGPTLARAAPKVAPYLTPLVDAVKTKSAVLGEPIAALFASLGEEEGAEIGAEYGPRIGLEPETGEDLGEGLGGLLGAFTPGIAGGAVSDVVGTAANKALGREGSEKALAAMERQKVDPSIGLVGNRGGALVENAPGQVPIIGAPVHGKQTRQANQLESALTKTTEKLRDAPLSNTDLDKGLIGARITEAAETGVDNLSAEISAMENAVTEAIGARTPVKIGNTRDAIEDLITGTEAGLQKVLRDDLARLESMAVPIHPQKHKLLQADLNAVNTRLEANPRPNLKNQLERQRAAITREMQDNLAVPYEQLRDFRTTIGKGTDGSFRLKAGQQKQAYGGVSEDLRGAAEEAGVLDEFTQMNRREQQVLSKNEPLDRGGDKPFLEKLSRKETGQAFNMVVEGGAKNAERLDVLRRNMEPEAWDELSADIIQRLGLAKPHHQDAEGTAFSAQSFLSRWNDLSDGSKQLLTHNKPELLNDLNDIAEIASAMELRGRAGNPSGTAQNVATIGAAAGTVASPARAVGIGLAATGAHSAAISNRLAKVIGKHHPPLLKKLGLTVKNETLERLPGQAVRTSNEASQEE